MHLKLYIDNGITFRILWYNCFHLFTMTCSFCDTVIIECPLWCQQRNCSIQKRIFLINISFFLFFIKEFKEPSASPHSLTHHQAFLVKATSCHDVNLSTLFVTLWLKVMHWFYPLQIHQSLKLSFHMSF